jgi:hypothetical protein
MKKAILVLAILLLATPALGVTGTITWTDAQNARFDRDRLKINNAVCTAVGLGAGCTQAQARTAFCAREGSSSPTHPCTVGGQSSGDVVVYGTVAEYLDKWVITSFFFPNLRQSQQIEDRNNFAKWQETASAAQKDAVCLAAGLAAGCLP